MQAIQRTINGQLEFGFNLRSSRQECAFSGTTVLRIAHGLRKMPTGFIVINLDAGVVIYRPTGAQYAWTDSTIYLVSTGTVNATIEVI